MFEVSPLGVLQVFQAVPQHQRYIDGHDVGDSQSKPKPYHGQEH